MPRAASAKRYARAVYEIALEEKNLDGWHEDLDRLAGVLDDRELSTLLDAPEVPTSHKLSVLKQVLEGMVGPLALNLVSLLATRKLAGLFPSILEEYERLLDAHEGIVRAEVATAVSLDEGQRDRIADALRGMLGKDIRVSNIVRPEILGGLVARVGNKLIDGSARAKLDEMRRSIAQRSP